MPSLTGISKQYVGRVKGSSNLRSTQHSDGMHHRYRGTRRISIQRTQEVGRRLALNANKFVYKQNCVASGPLYKNFRREGNRFRISFTNCGAGLVTKDGKEVTGFAIVGRDKQFHWAKAIIKGDEEMVYCDKVADPEAVRYAWADNPECNLANSEGLPAIPYRRNYSKMIMPQQVQKAKVIKTNTARD